MRELERELAEIAGVANVNLATTDGFGVFPDLTINVYFSDGTQTLQLRVVQAYQGSLRHIGNVDVDAVTAIELWTLRDGHRVSRENYWYEVHTVESAISLVRMVAKEGGA